MTTWKRFRHLRVHPDSLRRGLPKEMARRTLINSRKHIISCKRPNTQLHLRRISVSSAAVSGLNVRVNLKDYFATHPTWPRFVPQLLSWYPVASVSGAVFYGRKDGKYPLHKEQLTN